MAQGWRGSYTRYREFFLNIGSVYKKRADVRAFLEIILSIFTITLFIMLALRPTVVTIIGLLQQIKDRKQTLTALTQKVSNLKTAANLLQQNQNYLSDIDFAVPTSPNPDTLVQQVEGLAVKNSTDILAISVNQVPLLGKPTVNKVSSSKSLLPGGAKEMSFSVSVRGPYSNLAAFISDFEHLRITNKIDTLVINSSVTNNGLVIVAIISGRVPYLGSL